MYSRLAGVHSLGAKRCLYSVRSLPRPTCRKTNLSTLAQDPFAWSPSSDVSLTAFLRKNHPSVVGLGGTTPWVRVSRLEKVAGALDFEDLDVARTPYASAVETAKLILEEYSQKIITVRKNEKALDQENRKHSTRKESKAVNELAGEAVNKLTQVSKEHNLTCGRWLYYIPERNVDKALSRFAYALVQGALSETTAFGLKVSTTPNPTKSEGVYLLSLYVTNVYDEVALAEVLRAAYQSTGVRANSAKPDLYTLIGLSRRHPSGIKSTIWNPTDLVPKDELNGLLDEFWNGARSVNRDSI